MRPIQLITILEQEFISTRAGHHTPVMLWGPPGVGKSDMVREVAMNHQAPVIDIRLSQMEPSDLRGIPFRVNGSVEWAVPSILPNRKRHGAAGILFLDEITSAPPTVSAAAYQLILDRRLGEYQVPDGWAIFAAGNRQGDRGVTYSMPAPLANRFSHFEVETNLDDWVTWAYRNDIDERIIAFLRFRPELLFDFDPAHNPVAFPSPRSWEFAHRALQKFDKHPQLLQGALQACVGPAAGVELNAFVNSLDKMPDLDAIIAGDDVPVPDEIDLQYAIAAALVGRAIRAHDAGDGTVTHGRILEYARQFPQREMGVMLVSDMHRAIGEAIFSVPQFSDWAQAVSDVMLYES
ncbi:MAG: MoxR family ATPase [Candidatus Thiodiazotropha sp. (ex Lucina aurantia)]|uniref:AAA domain protein n=2 Tax=Candidatus Thiodiazotropha TaxID=1913444 RepID=A0A7Z0VKF3_9GAMM|nr:MoxR family ATPase [Candidatus Thiodiazotropha endolucinida]MBT3010327.1 MoxR family ATPase [Candidatus Thiodiazotropha sp. (ex Lucina pensylvanica)]MBT3014297.1 MoxR family ATPase [Candidatus Thiodiazotropha taylori]MBT3037995.1 MoxR family ATPase [Candidatus Thiodiazotropha sp. (ex Codakia orbicularis)]MBV2102406.1 MoxR family ATPase [Candidatus Thiodiazotropha sp. (ex Lucina aurantia)]MBT3021835.1 MoxR family ATPase [Candidatus Thiodiazotropha taylori]